MKILSPSEITRAASDAGAAKAHLTASSTMRLLVSACMAGAYISLGGILSMTLGFGFPELTASNPALQRLLSGVAFPIGLILVVVLGAELFTGNNAVLVPSMMQRRHGPGLTLRNWTLVYLGNLVGALAFTYFMVYRCGLTAIDPRHSAAGEGGRGQGGNAVGRSVSQGHRSQLVCMPGRMARSERQDSVGESLRLLAAGDGVCSPGLRALHRQYVFHPSWHNGRRGRGTYSGSDRQLHPLHSAISPAAHFSSELSTAICTFSKITPQT